MLVMAQLACHVAKVLHIMFQLAIIEQQPHNYKSSYVEMLWVMKIFIHAYFDIPNSDIEVVIRILQFVRILLELPSLVIH